MSKYEQLAHDLKARIEQGVWQGGDKLPSLRQTCSDYGLSLMTVMNAYQLLESQGVITAREKSGYFVAPGHETLTYPQHHDRMYLSDSTDINDFVFSVLQSAKQPSIIPFGSGFPDPTLFPQQDMARSLAKAAQKLPTTFAADNLPPGNLGLRKAISQRYAKVGLSVSPDEILVTSGAMESLNLSLELLTKEGDYVVVESPAFYGALQAIERLKLKAIAVATDPQTGIDLDALEEVLKNYPVKACWIMSRYQNPLGCSMSRENKERLYRLVQQYDTCLIEDDVYQELYESNSDGVPVKYFDEDGRVLHCSSFSKSLIAGYRVGWVAAGKYAVDLQKLQLMSTLSTSAPMQLVIADFIQSVKYERHLKGLRKKLIERKEVMYQQLRARLPDTVKVNYTAGSYFLWLELPKNVDATKLYFQAIAKGISLAPGNMFSTEQQYNHYIRLNASYPCTDEITDAIDTISELIQEITKNHVT
ncbi:GntR family transcriptional regulator [Endozoicomonas sp. OPT23]|uniref:aminotransferase-like domain-containing protein n=1 Tax=Endozoicomonas sp. OPT23 TaxID=2072845 RepID=UPI00129B29E0|nr:PLP-dependent aminotransferase family protein [Endozoicomonas sp. OPT23]MRI35486.1 GntR family transcriptional regulator [Endozoicomonas sp. OPT23]